MTPSDRSSFLATPGAGAVPSPADHLLHCLWVFSYAALLQVFHLMRRFEGVRGPSKTIARGM